MSDMNDVTKVETEDDAAEPETRAQGFFQMMREQGHEITLASEIDDAEAAERVRKKYARRALREKLLINGRPE